MVVTRHQTWGWVTVARAARVVKAFLDEMGEVLVGEAVPAPGPAPALVPAPVPVRVPPVHSANLLAAATTAAASLAWGFTWRAFGISSACDASPGA